MRPELLRIGSRITVLPVIHGSGDFAWEVRRVMLEQSFDCLAVPLPPSFQEDVEEAVQRLPVPTVVIQRPVPRYETSWSPLEDSEFEAPRHDDDLDESELESLMGSSDDSELDEDPCSFVPIDPCQAVITAVRVALGEHLPIRFIDLETARFEPCTAVLPDPYALKKVSLERFAAAILPNIARFPEGQPLDRVRHMAVRLRELETQFQSILFVCSVIEWPWVREAYSQRDPCLAEDEPVAATAPYVVDPQTLLFLLGELPFVTGLYERARSELEDDGNLSIDGVKELLVTARDAYRRELGQRGRKITPQLLARCTQYIRNLSLVERRLTPDLFTIVMAAKQTAGDRFAVQVAETARSYPYAADLGWPTLRCGVGQASFPDGEVVPIVSRLPGPPTQWRRLELVPRPTEQDIKKWKTRWNPFSQCSYPPEDVQIENFRSHLFSRAQTIMHADLVQTEKFTTSLKDGIDIRDTLRHWYDGDIYVKVLPPSRGRLDCAVMLFDSPADPRTYPWRTTWFAEHENESTLAFYATDFQKEMVGPGIGLATYGGALFLYPPIFIPDIWSDPRLNFASTMEERLLGAACLHSRCNQIALLAPLPPGPGWRRLAKRFRKSLVHVPLSQFGDATIQQLRMVHVLNGRDVRSYAAHFIRRA